jgi:hypothetical protein
MAVILKTLTGNDIPVEHRRDGREELFAVEAMNGNVWYLESGEEAAHLVAVMHEQEL